MAIITQSNGTTVVTIGSPSTVPVILDFGFASGGEGDIATTTVSFPLITAGANIICSAITTATLDHGIDDAFVEGIVAYAQNIIPGVSFDVVGYAPQNSWGRYNFIAILT